LRAGAGFTLARCGPFPDAPSAAAAPPEVRVSHGRDLRVELVSPREPLAWAVDPSYDEAAPFRCVWHSERRPGARPVPALREAVVPPGGRHTAVRVYSDDGAVGTFVHERPS
jgi:hypothetical protein